MVSQAAAQMYGLVVHGIMRLITSSKARLIIALCTEGLGHRGEAMKALGSVPSDLKAPVNTVTPSSRDRGNCAENAVGFRFLTHCFDPLRPSGCGMSPR